MIREEVINGLKHCKIGNCIGCPYDQIREESLHGKHDKWELVCNEQLTEDIVAILKEQEAVKPEPIMGTSICDCGKCKHVVAPGMNYCPVCGCRIDWN